MAVEMTLLELEANIEAILFVMGEAVELERIALATGQDEDTCRKVIHNMMDNYSERNRGIQIIELDGAFQMCSKPETYESLVRIAHVPKKHVLTDVLLETLSIIAYKQPVTKMEIEHIRGVKTDHAVNKLVEYNLVCEAGRLDAPGKFLRNFGIESLEDLPVVNPEKIEDFKLEAEDEVQLRLELEQG